MTVAHDDNSFDSATLSRRLNNFNCEFYLQSQVAISEFAEMIIKNVQYIEENANILDPKSIQGFVKKKKIREVPSNAGHETEQRNSDVKTAIHKVRQFVESESAFFNAFLEEGLRFSTSLYLFLIWIRVLKHVFQDPDEAAKHLNDHPFFKKFVARPSMKTYIDGLCDSLQSLCIGSPVKRSNVKRRLSDILTEEALHKQ